MLSALRHIRPGGGVAAAVLSGAIAVGAAPPAAADLCDLPPALPLADFPRQPLNIFVPRGRSSGAIRLSSQIAEALESLTDADGAPLGVEVNVLTKFGGSTAIALDFFEGLPPNGYNIVQLNDTYASLVAQAGQADAALVPISFAQIAFSQVYVRGDDDRFSDLDTFADFAVSRADAPPRIARFGTEGAELGLEDILLDRFAETMARVPAVDDGADGAAAPAPVPLPMTQIGYESAASRYYSLFDETLPEDARSDALLEQPGDVADLIHNDLLKPIFTLLPQAELSEGFTERLGDTPGFSGGASPGCPMQYRFRGFFVPRDVPDHRRAVLERMFTAAFNTEAFQQINRENFVDLLYPHDDVREAYCSPERARAFFDARIESYAACFRSRPSTAPDGELVVDHE